MQLALTGLNDVQASSSFCDWQDAAHALRGVSIE